jgi:hypothetical protein
MGEVISMQDYLERKSGPTQQDISKRLADIALQQLLLASEKHRLEAQLSTINRGE